MGWSESPPFFCAATKTAQDVAMANIQAKALLDPHPLENIMLNLPELRKLPKLSQTSTSKFIKLLEVYIDDFILITIGNQFLATLYHIASDVAHSDGNLTPLLQ